MIRILYTTVFATIFLFFASCESIIDIDLNDASPQLVIESNVIEGTNLLDVRITQTASYFDSEPVPTITNAIVRYINEDGISTSIPHINEGHYQLEVTALTNNTFSLEVDWNGTTYYASSFMPDKVPIIELRTEESTAVGFGNNSTNDGPQYILFVAFDDPAGADNYYRITYKVNGVDVDQTEIFVLDDKNSDGQYIDVPIQFGSRLFDSEDVVEVSLISFDKNAYNYYFALADIVSSSGNPTGGSAAPGNPRNNWTENILGHFTAYSVDRQTIVMP